MGQKCAQFIVIILGVFGVVGKSGSSNVVKDCPTPCVCGNEHVVMCEDEHFKWTYIPKLPPTTTDLLFRTNNLGEIYLDTLENITYQYGGVKIERLDLSANNIVAISPVAFSRLIYLKELKLDFNYLRDQDGLQKAIVGLRHIHLQKLSLQYMDIRDDSIPPNIFEPLTFQNTIQYIDMSNNAINGLDFRILANLTSLYVFRIKNNTITLVSESTNSLKFPSIQYLDLASNNIMEMPFFCVQDGSILENMLQLQMDNNFLTYLDDEMFNCLKNVQEMSLSANPLNYIPENLIKEMSSLESFFLDNLLRFPVVIEPRAFASSSLKLLSLRGNELSTDMFLIPTLGNLDALTSLDLDGNDFGELPSLPPFIIENSLPPNIETLSLRDCRLESVPKFNHSRIITLDLSKNEVRKLEPQMFDGFPNLSALTIQYNRLTAVSDEVFPDSLQNRLMLFGIKENPLLCLCSLVWLQSWMAREEFKFGEQDDTPISCIDPVTAEVVPLINANIKCDPSGHPLAKSTVIIVSVLVTFMVLFIAIFIFMYRKQIKMYMYLLSTRRRRGDELITESETV